MEETTESSEIQYCSACLCNSVDYKLQDFVIKYTQFWQIFEVASIKLCYICRRLAQRAELFIQNVQSNQILLQNCIGDISTSTIEEAKNHLKIPVTLSQHFLDPINILENGNMSYGTVCVEVVKVKEEEIDVEMQTTTIKTEKTDEGCDLSRDILEEFEEIDEPTTSIKIEDDIPKRRPTRTSKNNNIGTVEKKLKLSKSNDKSQKKNSKTPIKNAELRNKMHAIKQISISEEEYLEERRQLALKQRYLSSSFKCESCIKGFNYKEAYHTHMKRHTDEMGDHECCYCKVRMKKKLKLLYHTKNHLIRYKCTICGVLRASRSTMLEHYNSVHKAEETHLPCPHCKKTFRRQMSRRRHIQHKHLTKERVTCDFCHKTYATREGLKAHMMALHPKDVSSERKHYKCEECGAEFLTPKGFKDHQLTHSGARDFYCVECDKAYKTDTLLKQHLKTTQIHVNVAEFPLGCEQCEKRFMKPRELERHVNAVHLDIKPYKCDVCDKSFTCPSTLRDHRRVVHEGYKKPLKYCCEYCDKRFSNSSVLKAHIRTHTGERPYQCDDCPARFSQSGVLATHKKLIHQRLTRYGNPK